jgi:hypothetical protein
MNFLWVVYYMCVIRALLLISCRLDSYSKETTPLNQIFGGYIRTEGIVKPWNALENVSLYGSLLCVTRAWLCACARLCVCVCACVCERERERESACTIINEWEKVLPSPLWCLSASDILVKNHIVYLTSWGRMFHFGWLKWMWWGCFSHLG